MEKGSAPIEDYEELGGCGGCVALQGRVMHLRLAFEAEKMVYRETKQQLDKGTLMSPQDSGSEGSG